MAGRDWECHRITMFEATMALRSQFAVFNGRGVFLVNDATFGAMRG
jgi:hypothetical protein